MQNCNSRPRLRPQTSGDNIKPSTMPVRTRSPATVQLQKHGLENLQAEAPKIPTKPRPPRNTHSRNSGQTGERYRRSHTASNPETTPRANICQFSKRWWNKDLEKLRKQAERTRRRFNKHGRQEDEELWKEQRRTFKREMNKCKRDTWQKFVSEADEYDIWKLSQHYPH